MCGISGIWGAEAGRAIDAMVAAMCHRGPDDNGTYRDERVALGMTRLAIIDVSAAGHQPMQTPDKAITIIYNGEVYNFQSERRLLEAKGYRFNSASDTEVLLHMYEEYGDDFLLRLRGMFALAIYDKRRGRGRERLLLARDHLGIKPLVYARAAGRLVFASEIKALLASGLVQPEVDPVAMRLLLTYGSVYQPRTILRGVETLLPAHRMIIEGGGTERIERYWSLGADRRTELKERSYEGLVSEVGRVLEESVRLQLVSDVPLGAFLSGGVDSSLLVALMARQIGSRVKTFSVGFEDEGSGIDETDEAERTARFLGTDHTRVVVRGDEVRDRIEHIAYGLDQPSVDGANSYFISMAARRAVTVAISGTGGDEMFAGYPWFIGMVLEEMKGRAGPWRAMARSLLASIARQPAFDPLLLLRGGGRVYQARVAAGFVAKYSTKYQIFGSLGAARILSPELRRFAQAGRASDYDLSPVDELPDASAIRRVTGLCLRGYLNNQLLRDIDAVSMAHSLEVRVPYLDPVIADTTLSLPDTAKIAQMNDLAKLPVPEQSTYRRTGAKRILIDVGRPLLSEGFDLQVKRGFSMPFDSWLKGTLKEVWQDALSAEQVRRRNLLDAKEVAAVKQRYAEGAISWAQPWLLMILELWCREVLDRKPSALLEREKQWRSDRRIAC